MRTRVIPASLWLALLLGPTGCESEKDVGPNGTVDDDNALHEDRKGDAQSNPSSTKADGSVQDPTDDPQGDAGSQAGARCGTRGGVACKDSEFCLFAADAQCGATDRGGSCQTKPELCPQLYAPVCGCDDKTYASECSAHGAGVSVKASGECAKPPAGKTCGGIAALKCGAGQFCNYEPEAGGQGCDGSISDAAGVCQPQPGACTREYAPVCGCDRKSYGNACDAHTAGASILHQGACTEVDCKALGGRAVDGIGPAPQCKAGETNHTWLVYANGNQAIEGTACCVP